MSIANAAPIVWTEDTANKVYDAWDNSPVSMYKNTFFGPRSRYHGVDYIGLGVDVSQGFYAKNIARIDMHKKEVTNGCIFIVDESSPPWSDTAALNIFEPQFTKDIQAGLAQTPARALEPCICSTCGLPGSEIREATAVDLGNHWSLETR